MSGRLVVIYGPMFSSKTTELIHRSFEAVHANQIVQVFRPLSDSRDEAHAIVSHDGEEIPAQRVENGAALLRVVSDDTDYVVIDEINLFPSGIVETVHELLDNGKFVILAGMDKDWRGKPFAPIPDLLIRADEVVALTADCAQCGQPAEYSQRLIESSKLIVVGGADMYEPRCNECYQPPLT